MTVFILSRYEGDYDVLLGVYSTVEKAREASAKDFLEHGSYEENYRIYYSGFDEPPEDIGYDEINHNRQRPKR